MTTILIKPYTFTELAKLYGVSRKTMHRWVRPFRDTIGELQGRYFLVDQVKIIFDKIGYPFETDVQKSLMHEKKSKKVWASERSVGKYWRQTGINLD
jgi:hypothetical protein